MKKILFILSLAVASTQLSAQSTKDFGEVKVEAAKAVSGDDLLTVIKTMKASGKEMTDVTITGPIEGVCQAKGCWMTMVLADGQKMTIKFKDYAFFMPMDAAGRTFIAHGKLFTKTTSVEELRHLAEDAGKSKKEIKKIKKPKQEIRFEADGVTLS